MATITNIATATTSLQLLRLLQLASSNLPVGGYSFSNGLEYAIDSQQLKTVAQVQAWIAEVSGTTLSYTDVPIIKRQYACIENQHWSEFNRWNTQLLALRETRELLQADLAMGQALLRLATEFGVVLPECCEVSGESPRVSYITVFSLLARHFEIPLLEACMGHAWTLIENQVLAATKLLPMGQTAAQKMLAELLEPSVDRVHTGLVVEDASIGLSLPGLAMSSALHESQYSRLYAS